MKKLQRIGKSNFQQDFKDAKITQQKMSNIKGGVPTASVPSGGGCMRHDDRHPFLYKNPSGQLVSGMRTRFWNECPEAQASVGPNQQ